MNKRPYKWVCWALWSLLALGSAARAQEATEVGKTPGVVEGDKPGTSSAADDDMAKVGSAASKAQFNKLRASVNPFPVMSLLPGAATHYTASALTGSLELTPDVQFYASLTRSFKVPGHADSLGLGIGWQPVGAAGAVLVPLRAKPESSVALDMGALYKSSLFKASASAFLVKFKDRIASSFEPAIGSAHSLRVDNPAARGVELQAGTLPFQGTFSGFGVTASATYIQGYADDSRTALGYPLAVFGDAGKVAAQFPASGRLFPDPPRSMAGLALQYTKGPVLVNLAGKYTGRRNITVVGEQSLAGFTTFDLNVALQLPSDRWFKGPTLRLDVSNIADKRFMLPGLYGGTARLTSITLQSDF